MKSFTLKNPSGEHISVNIVLIICADLSYVKYLIGKCSSTSTFGCFYCKKPQEKWSESTVYEKQSLKQILLDGADALRLLGPNPDRKSKIFIEFQKTHFGQYIITIFKSFSFFTMPVCGLHVNLAHHRYLWSYAFDVIKRLDKQHLISAAFITIGCNYLSLQFDAYFKSKNKYYDGSPTFKMIGSDCKQIEKNIDKFIMQFLDPGKSINEKNNEVLRNVVQLYRAYNDLAGDIRSIDYNSVRLKSFQTRVNMYIALFSKHSRGSCVKGKPYMHILQDHVSEWMLFWGKIMSWGYGYFSCNGGEHLNKRTKCMEFSETNLNDERFCTITRNLRVKQFHYPENLLPSKTTITCQAYQEILPYLT